MKNLSMILLVLIFGLVFGIILGYFIGSGMIGLGPSATYQDQIKELQERLIKLESKIESLRANTSSISEDLLVVKGELRQLNNSLPQLVVNVIDIYMQGILSFFTRFEKIEVGAAYAEGDETTGFKITLSGVKNTGSADAWIVDIYINGRSINNWVGITVNMPFPIAVPSGARLSELTISIPKSLSGISPFKSGSALTVTLHTTAGKDYPIPIVLP